jgi:hypothetical protein
VQGKAISRINRIKQTQLSNLPAVTPTIRQLASLESVTWMDRFRFSPVEQEIGAPQRATVR